jgi:hypothetical protein
MDMDMGMKMEGVSGHSQGTSKKQATVAYNMARSGAKQRNTAIGDGATVTWNGAFDYGTKQTNKSCVFM